MVVGVCSRQNVGLEGSGKFMGKQFILPDLVIGLPSQEINIDPNGRIYI